MVNNCSSAVRVTVSDSGASESFDLDAENNYARGIAYAAGRLFVVGGAFPRVFSYQTSGQRDSASDFNPDSDNFSPEGITFANGRFYVVDSNFGRNIDKVYVYQASGQREPAFDFNLPSANGWPGGITFANDRLYVVDKIDRKVYAYGVSAQRDAAFDFDLDSANRDPVGITFANQRFYVVDDGDGKVYAYHASGQRDSASDFDLDSDNGNAQGITFANDRFYVVDQGDGPYGREGEVYVYDGPTQSGGDGSDTPPSFGTATADHQTYDAGSAIGPLTLPAASGGDGFLTYSLAPSVAGLTFSASTRQLTGTPSAAGTYAMTYTVTDEDGDTDTLSFTITVEDSEDGGDSTGTSYVVNDTLPGVPSGVFFPAVTSGGSIVATGGGTTITLRNGGYFELNDGARYTCTSPDGCTVESGTVTRGTLVGGSSSDSFAPADEQSFNSLVVGNRFHGAGFYADFVSAGRFTESGSLPGSYTYASTGSNTGTLTQTYDGGQYGGSCTVLLTFVSATTGTYTYTCASAAPGRGSWTITSTDVPHAPRVTPVSGTNTELDVRFPDSFEAGESRAYDFQFRRKAAGAAWTSPFCIVRTNNSSSAGRGVVAVTAEGFQPATVYQVRYRYRNSGSCDPGSPGNWSLIGEGRTGGAGQGLGFSESGSAIRSIPENLPGGINVGVPVSAADDAGDREPIDITIDLLDLAPR